MAHSPGYHMISAFRCAQEITHLVSVYPSVATPRWEPDEATLVPGDTAFFRAVARDSTGEVVAIIPWQSANDCGNDISFAAAHTPFEEQLLLVVGRRPGRLCVFAKLGARVDTLRVTVRGDSAAEPGVAADNAP